MKRTTRRRFIQTGTIAGSAFFLTPAKLFGNSNSVEAVKPGAGNNGMEENDSRTGYENTNLDSSVLSANEYFPLCLQNGVDSMLIGPLGSPDGGWHYSEMLFRQSTIGWYKNDRRESPSFNELVELANIYTTPCIIPEVTIARPLHKSTSDSSKTGKMPSL